MATLEELTVEATAEIEAAKPLYAQVNNERREFTDAEYDQAITDLANSKYEEQENGYKQICSDFKAAENRHHSTSCRHHSNRCNTLQL